RRFVIQRDGNLIFPGKNEHAPGDGKIAVDCVGGNIIEFKDLRCSVTTPGCIRDLKKNHDASIRAARSKLSDWQMDFDAGFQALMQRKVCRKELDLPGNLFTRSLCLPEIKSRFFKERFVGNLIGMDKCGETPCKQGHSGPSATPSPDSAPTHSFPLKN